MAIAIGGNTRPLRIGGVREQVVDDSLVIYDDRGERVHILNRTGAAIWALCDGRHTVGRMAGRLGRVFDQPPKTIQGDVLELLEQLSQAGLVASR